MPSLPFRRVVSHKSSRSAQLELAPQKSYILRKNPSPNQREESTARFGVLAALFSISEGSGRRGSKRKGAGMHLTLTLLISRGIGQGHPTTIFGKYLFGRRFEI